MPSDGFKCQFVELPCPKCSRTILAIRVGMNPIGIICGFCKQESAVRIADTKEEAENDGDESGTD